jgi:hypothetical protein
MSCGPPGQTTLGSWVSKLYKSRRFFLSSSIISHSIPILAEECAIPLVPFFLSPRSQNQLDQIAKESSKMRFIVLFSHLASTAFAIDTWGEAFTRMYGECGSECAATEFKDLADCGDPASSDSTRCYCEAWATMPYGSNEFALCMADCDVNPADLDFTQWINDIEDVCDNEYGSPDYDSDIDEAETGGDTSSTTTSAMPTSPSSADSEDETEGPSPSPTDDPNDTDPEAEDQEATPTPTPDAATTLSSSRVAIAAGIFAFVGYAL